jgi:hypothetical protein
MQNFNTNNIPPTEYRTLDEIRLRKAQLLTEIQKDSNKMQGLWDNLFHQPPKSQLTPTSRFAGMMKTGAGVLDGLILGWKLYRKFSANGKKSSKKKKKFSFF